jgi:uncharacterized protein YPO0396
VVAETCLSSPDDFSRVGVDIKNLRKRLGKIPTTEIYDTFPPYFASYHKKFGLPGEQAIDLFYQTVSMKSVGNLTDFVRDHMLEPFPVAQRIAALVNHFDDLDRAHNAVLKAKDQIERLTPLIADCDCHRRLSAEVDEHRRCREGLPAWFAIRKAVLLKKGIVTLDDELARLAVLISSLVETQMRQRTDRDEIKQDLTRNGGDRLEDIKRSLFDRNKERESRQRRAEKYSRLAYEAGLSGVHSEEAFVDNQRALITEQAADDDRQADIQNDITECSVKLHRLRSSQEELVRELRSLHQRRSNIPLKMLELRDELCNAANVRPEKLPFVGELLQVRPEELDWEGAIERRLHRFGLSVLVKDEYYSEISSWVDRTDLERRRLVYLRVREQRMTDRATLHRDSLVHKLAIKTDSIFYNWLEWRLVRNYDYACCETLDQFRVESRAITRAGQIKGSSEDHEKNDLYSIDNRSHYVLGWSNENKIAAIESQRRDLDAQISPIVSRIEELQGRHRTLRSRLALLNQLAAYDSFRDLDWKPLAVEIEALDQEKRRLEEGSDILRTLYQRLEELELAAKLTETGIEDSRRAETRSQERRRRALDQLTECERVISAAPDELKELLVSRMETVFMETWEWSATRSGAGGPARSVPLLTVEAYDIQERELRHTLQKRIEEEERSISHLQQKIVQAMESYRNSYKIDAQEVDASMNAAEEYRKMLIRLESDDLPSFQAKFKVLLNENTIREIVGFQSQLFRERKTIQERIESINRSLRAIDYTHGHYIRLEAEPETDHEIHAFHQELRVCTEGALTGSEDNSYSEAKFLQVKSIIEKFQGRPGQTEHDARWTHKVTDVRNWFTFAASERWRENDAEYRHYADSDGQSGGQKEKLAYTVLAASLAYQFGLERASARSRSFRLVVIDEAFGRGSDESAEFGLKLFGSLGLQLLIVTPLQKIHVIEPFVANVGFVHNEDGRLSMLRNLTIEEYRAERSARSA